MAMLTHLLPLLVPMQGLTFCLERILDKVPYETVALVHVNTTEDMTENIYGKLSKDRKFAWMRFNMDDHLTLENHLLKDNLFHNIFFMYFLDTFMDCFKTHEFIVKTNLDYQYNQIYIINKYPSDNYLLEIRIYLFRRHLFNTVILFWNTSGRGFGLEGYTFRALNYGFLIIKFPNDQCKRNIYNTIFFEKLTNLHNASMIVFGATDPPKILRTAAMLNGKYEYSIGGHDVLITETIFKHLNVRPEYKIINEIVQLVTDTEYASYIKLKNNTEERIFDCFQISRHKWSNAETEDSYRQVYEAAALDLNTERVRYGNYRGISRFKDYTNLYPHDTDNFILIVPKIFKSKTEYSQILKSPLIYVWTPTVAIVAIIRFIFNKIRKTDKKLVDISLETFGLSLGMSFSAAISSAAENCLLWFFCLGTMLSGMLLSSSMFQGFTLQLDHLTINNLKQLEASGLTVYLPIYVESVEYFFENIPQKLKLKYMISYEISDMIQYRNTEGAYVINERKFNILFGNDKDVWHVIERFGTEHLSYRLRLFSSLEDRMNTMVQRCINHGIIKYLIDKNKRLITGIKPSGHFKEREVISSNVEPLSLSDMRNSFLLGALGLILSAVTFLAEKIYFCKMSRQT